MKKIIFLVLVTLCFPSFSHAELSRSDVEKIVHEYILTHGKEIVDAVQAYEKQKQIELSREIIRDHTPRRGNPKAPITIVEFGEFQCPFCMRAQPTVKEIDRRYGDRVVFYFKHLPLSFHPQAKPAALAAQAAHKQGKFWEFSEKMWENQEYVGEKLFVEAAKELKLDMKKFNKDRASKEIEAQITTDLEDAERVGARGTPFFLINGRPVSGAQDIEVFAKIIEEELKEKEK